ncbi:MAG: sensor histidine kinase [Siphonobacter sp.]
MINSLDEFRMAMGASIAFMIFMASFIILFLILYKQRQDRQKEAVRKLNEDHQQALLVASIRSQEVEARRIAADLHDDIGTLLSATRMSLSLVTRHIDDTPESKESIDQTKRLLEEAVENVRRLSKDLLPPALDKFGVVSALTDLIHKWERSNPSITIDFNHETFGGRFEPDIELTIFRVIQELLHNSLKHAQATYIAIKLAQQSDQLCCSLSDNGIGYSPVEVNKRANSLGLKNIESRLKIVSGRVTFEASPGKGTYTSITIPHIRHA